MTKKHDLSGQKFNRLKVLYPVSSTRSGMPRWACLCDCGNLCDAATKHLLSGKWKSCGCLKKDICGPKHPQWGGVGELSGDAWSNIVTHSLQRTEVSITIDKQYAWDLFLKQNRKCALSEVPLTFGTRGGYKRTASLDRIDSSLGYDEGDVQWVHKDVNKMKNIFEQNYFIQMCKNIAEVHK